VIHCKKEKRKEASKEKEQNHFCVAMLLFVFTVSISDTKPMPQVQITESVSRANNSLLPPPNPCFALLCYACCGNRQRNYSTRGLIALTSLKLKTIENSYLQFSSAAIRKYWEREKNKYKTIISKADIRAVRMCCEDLQLNTFLVTLCWLM
jgi:hypothetical protein